EQRQSPRRLPPWRDARRLPEPGATVLPYHLHVAPPAGDRRRAVVPLPFARRGRLPSWLRGDGAARLDAGAAARARPAHHCAGSDALPPRAPVAAGGAFARVVLPCDHRARLRLALRAALDEPGPRRGAASLGEGRP